MDKNKDEKFEKLLMDVTGYLVEHYHLSPHDVVAVVMMSPITQQMYDGDVPIPDSVEELAKIYAVDK